MSSIEYLRWDSHPPTSLLDLEGCAEDMLSASEFFDRFVEAFSGNDYTLLDALATAAVIRYGRSFGPGIRAQLDIDRLPATTLEELELHRHVLAVRSKYAAHPVNMQETHSVTLAVRRANDGLEVTAVSSQTLVATGISVDLAKAASQLCLRWFDWLNEQKQTECRRLLEVAERIGQSELASWATGPVDVSRDPHKNRRQRR